ncbi:hypothetical protein [Bombella mellum]|uniref:Uncharacterized protein n=1 Tax=Bombella mellum TaxID=2039288 RepID=A0ABR5ZRU4_9PROT|nr:hypothetical protein [Bombella mellum]MBA5726968.1 hypothetical protein [Bombella mellum]
MPQIVTINESVVRGAAPNLLQQKGVLVSLGGTNTAAGTLSFLSEAADLTALLPSTQTSQTATTSGTGETSGTAQAGSPAATPSSATQELQAMVASWFANSSSWFANSSFGVWVLEMGSTKAIADGLGSFIASNPLTFYGYVLPRGSQKTDTGLASFLGNQGGNNARIYFFLCSGKDEAGSLTASPSKAVFYGAEAAGASQTGEHLASTILGGIADEAAPLLADRFDTSALFAGISRVESGLSEVEGGIKDMMAAVKEKKAVPPAEQVGPAA